MKKEFTNLKDFIEDVSFKRWIMENSEKDRLIWEEWLSNHPEKEGVLEDAASILTGIQFNPSIPSPSKVEKELKKIHLSIAAKEAAYKQPKQMLGSLRRKSIWSVAAAIALLLAITFVIPYFLQESMIEHQTAFGEFKELQLPDGSKVVLNANSTLKYEATTPRKIWLEGEAFFEVTKKPSTRENFQVQTNDLTVTVLGTIFNVNSRNAQTKVFLEEGKVILEGMELTQNTLEMIPGELVSYSKKDKKIIEKRKAKTLENTSWRNGVIRFTEVPLSTVLDEITAIYGIQFDNKIDKIFSGGIPNENLGIALETLKEIYGIEIEQQGEVYIIKE